jgi:hypothetical protein
MSIIVKRHCSPFLVTTPVRLTTTGNFSLVERITSQSSLTLLLTCIIHKPKIRQKIDPFGLVVEKIVFGEGDLTVDYRA